MPANDPTSVSESASFMIPGDVEFTVDDVARIQALAVSEAAGDGATSSGAILSTSSPVVDSNSIFPNLAPSLGASSASASGLRLRNVSGRYRGRSGGNNELELRVDVDGRRPTRRVSGDFYRAVGGTVTYVGSFIIATPILTVSPTQVIIDGEGLFTFQTSNSRLRVTIPRVGEFLTPAAAVAQFLTSNNVPGARYTCAYESPFFRRVEFESDFVSNVTPFKSYYTGALASGGSARELTVAAAFAEAGIEMVDTEGINEVPIESAGDNQIWTNRELHAAMEDHFDRWQNLPGWRVWLLSATIHERGAGLRGIMFDQEGAQRQGCAVFHDVIGGSTDPIIRAQLRTYVHELGHCFNLYHSHQKEFMQPPEPNRLDALSWMHYPDYFQSNAGIGATAYWAAFPFQFDDLELVHLRHAFRNNIIMGGAPFGIGAADIDPLVFADPIEDNSGLRLHLRSARSYYFGEPVVVELKLELTDMRGKRVNARLHPNDGYVHVGIRKPGGVMMVYRPFLQQCAEPEMTTLDANVPAVYDSAYLGYGKDGLTFDEPGIYELRALYYAVDGSQVLSNVLQIRVEAPVNEDERRIADLFLGDEQGKLLYLLGSDSRTVQNGNNAFDEVLAQYSDHPMAVYARLVKGMNGSRPFKTIDTASNQMQVRPANYEESRALLSDVVDLSLGANPGVDPTADVGLDNISLDMVMVRLTEVHQAAGDMERAQATARQMIQHFDKPLIPEFVKAQIKRRAEPYLLAEEGEVAVAEDAPAPKRSRSRKKENK